MRYSSLKCSGMAHRSHSFTSTHTSIHKWNELYLPLIIIIIIIIHSFLYRHKVVTSEAVAEQVYLIYAAI